MVYYNSCLYKTGYYNIIIYTYIYIYTANNQGFGHCSLKHHGLPSRKLTTELEPPENQWLEDDEFFSFGAILAYFQGRAGGVPLKNPLNFAAFLKSKTHLPPIFRGSTR